MCEEVQNTHVTHSIVGLIASNDECVSIMSSLGIPVLEFVLVLHLLKVIKASLETPKFLAYAIMPLRDEQKFHMIC